MSGDRNVVLAGPMGSGKSAVGRVVASRLGWPFIDTDDVVVAASGRSIPELFAQQGESAFRALEAEAIAAVCERDGLVVAVGGGAVVDPGSAARLRERSRVIVLDATADALAERVEAGIRAGQRPLLAGAEDVAGRLASIRDAREQAYAEVAHARLDTTGRTVGEVADLVLALLEGAR